MELLKPSPRRGRPRSLNRGRSALTLAAARVLLAAVAVAVVGVSGPSPAAAEDVPAGSATGVYDVHALVFGTAADGLVGRPTSSGQVLRGEDRLVGLPGCTVSSCPWLAPGTGLEGEWGPQTSCAEGDGLCWVELTNPATGACATAPVLDLGPMFVRDNWWAPTAERSYGLPQGQPAAAHVALGADLGFGPGRSDDGYDATGWSAPPAINVAAGTWADLGLPADAGTAPLRVRLLWQAGIFRADACGGAAEPVANATATDALNLRAAPDPAGDLLGTVPFGGRVTVVGAQESGYLPVRHGGRDGWVAAAYVLLDEGGGSS